MQVVDANGNMFGYDSITVAGQDGKPKTLSSAIKLVSLVRNQTGSTLTKGTVVYINGGSGNKPTVTKALATSDATSAQTYGVVQSNIGNNKNGYVVVAGALDGLNTSAYAPGTQLYLSSTTAGAWTSTKQLAPAHLVYVGIVVRQHVNQGVVEVKIQNGYELDEIHDVQIISPTNGQTLVYDSVTSLWKNASGGGGGGVTNITVNPPLATTGGSTPDLSITEADGSTDGYLTTADWTTFNNKQDAITLTTTGTSGAATLVGSTLNIPQYSGGGGGGSTTWGSITGTLSSQTDLQTALDAKQDNLVSGTNIKTINGSSVLGSGDLTISGLKGIHAINPIVSGDQISASLQSATSGTGGNFSTNRLLAYPFIPAQSFTSSSLQINVAVLGAGSLCRIAVYTDLNGAPDTSIFISSNLDCSTTGLKTVTASINFVAGTTYWLAFHGGTAAAVTQLLVAQMFPLKYANINTMSNHLWRSLNFSTPTPTTFGGGNSFAAANVPAIIITKA